MNDIRANDVGGMAVLPARNCAVMEGAYQSGKQNFIKEIDLPRCEQYISGRGAPAKTFTIRMQQIEK
jgi:hypothetical protein